MTITIFMYRLYCFLHIVFFQLIAFLTKIKSFEMKLCIDAMNGKLQLVAIIKIKL